MRPPSYSPESSLTDQFLLLRCLQRTSMQTAGSSLKIDAYLVTFLFKITTNHLRQILTCKGLHRPQSQLHMTWPELPPLAAGSSMPPTETPLPTFLFLNSLPHARTAKGETVVPTSGGRRTQVTIRGIYGSPWHAEYYLLPNLTSRFQLENSSHLPSCKACLPGNLASCAPCLVSPLLQALAPQVHLSPGTCYFALQHAPLFILLTHKLVIFHLCFPCSCTVAATAPMPTLNK